MPKLIGEGWKYESEVQVNSLRLEVPVNSQRLDIRSMSSSEFMSSSEGTLSGA
jgi:hypothetical protein